MMTTRLLDSGQSFPTFIASSFQDDSCDESGGGGQDGMPHYCHTTDEDDITCHAINRTHPDNTIHSGHFMVSCLSDDDQDDSEEGRLDVQMCQIVEAPAIVKVEAPEHNRPSKQEQDGGYNFANATRQLQNTYTFGLSNQLAIDASLVKMFDHMKIAYSGKLTSPKWKHFKGHKVKLKDKIRLNNIIWREWHMQYIQRRKPVVCQFEAPISDKVHVKSESVVMEGKYWRRNIVCLAAEYQKWRQFFKRRLGNNQKDQLMEEVASHAELLDRIAQTKSAVTYATAFYPDMSLLTEHMLIDDDDALPDFSSDTLFSSFSHHLFDFPDPKEIAMCGFGDIVQPGLMQLQPTASMDETMDTETPLSVVSEMRAFGRSAANGGRNLAGKISLVDSQSRMFQDYSISVTQTLDTTRRLGMSLPSSKGSTTSLLATNSTFSYDADWSEFCINQLQQQLMNETAAHCMSNTSPIRTVDSINPPTLTMVDINKKQTSNYDKPANYTSLTLSDGSVVQNEDQYSRMFNIIPSKTSVKPKQNSLPLPFQRGTGATLGGEGRGHISSQILETTSAIPSQNRSTSHRSLSYSGGLTGYAAYYGNNASTQTNSFTNGSFPDNFNTPILSEYSCRGLQQGILTSSSQTGMTHFARNNESSITGHSFSAAHQSSSLSAPANLYSLPSVPGNGDQMDVDISSVLRELSTATGGRAVQFSSNPSPPPAYSSSPSTSFYSSSVDAPFSANSISSGPTRVMTVKGTKTTSTTATNQSILSQQLVQGTTDSIRRGSAVTPQLSASFASLNDNRSRQSTAVGQVMDKGGAGIFKEDSHLEGERRASTGSLTTVTQMTRSDTDALNKNKKHVSFVVPQNPDVPRLRPRVIAPAPRPVGSGFAHPQMSGGGESKAIPTNTGTADISNAGTFTTILEHLLLQGATSKSPVTSTKYLKTTLATLAPRLTSSIAMSTTLAPSQYGAATISATSLSCSSVGSHHSTSNQMSTVQAGREVDVVRATVTGPTPIHSPATAISAAMKFGRISTPSPECLDRSRHASSESSSSFQEDMAGGGGSRPIEERRAYHMSAEQRRRGNIKGGFEMLNELVPSLKDMTGAKINKATTLQKTAELCRRMRREREESLEEAAQLRQEINRLQASINDVQSQLPASGLPIIRQPLDRSGELYDDYIRVRTLANWKFWIFSFLVRPLFESYTELVLTTSVDDFCRGISTWMEQHFCLVALRPAAMTALRQLSMTTSILSDPASVAQQAKKAVSRNNEDEDTE